MSRTVTIPAREAHEAIRTISEHPAAAVVEVVVGLQDDDGNWLDGLGFNSFRFDGKAYSDLMAKEAPSWAPGKPAGTYRNEDLWYLVDLARAEAVRQAREHAAAVAAAEVEAQAGVQDHGVSRDV